MSKRKGEDLDPSMSVKSKQRKFEQVRKEIVPNFEKSLRWLTEMAGSRWLMDLNKHAALQLDSHCLSWRLDLDDLKGDEIPDMMSPLEALPAEVLQAFETTHPQRFSKVREVFSIFNRGIERLRETRPAPSTYARDWSSAQRQWDDILCLRPTERRGLPLSVLHRVFLRYQLQRVQPLPLHDTVAIRARQAASELCMYMGDSFATEPNRSEAFNKAVSPLFPTFADNHAIRPANEMTHGVVGFILTTHVGVVTPFPRIVREDKREVGEAGDPFVQAARVFHMLMEVIQANESTEAKRFLESGAPMFILTVTGPLLCIAGAFYDGRACVFEPLGPSYWMLEDDTGGRQRDIARALYALYAGVTELAQLSPSYFFTHHVAHHPDVPRIYDSITTSPLDLPQTANIALALSAPFPPRPLSMFTGCITIDSEVRPVLAKILWEPYGTKVHTLLYEHGFAPRLYGCSFVEGAPTLNVMEHLQDLDGWMTLYHFKKKVNESAVLDLTWLQSIRRTIDDVLTLLEENNMVHGDLRANNILVQCDGNHSPLLRPETSNTASNKAYLKVIDFEWAGTSGQVSYPVSRNDTIKGLKWPAAIGARIENGHDRKLVDSWWPGFVSPS